MTFRSGLRRGAVVLACLSSGSAWAQTRISERPFRGHEQLVIADPTSSITADATNGTVVLKSSRLLRVTGYTPRARNVKSISVSRDAITIVLQPGAAVHCGRAGDRMIVDMTDPVPKPTPLLPPTPNAATISPRSSLSPGLVDRTRPPVSDLIPGLPAPFLATVEGEVKQALRQPPAQLPVRPPAPALGASGAADNAAGNDGEAAGGPTTTVVSGPDPSRRLGALPFSRSAGVAMRRHGSRLLLVFDESRTIDAAIASALPGVSHATVVTDPGSTCIAFDVPNNVIAALTRDDDGWRLSVSDRPRPSPAMAMTVTTAEGGLRFVTPHPSRVVVVRDPETGARLLVGTVRDPAASVPLSRRSALFELDQSETGVFVEAWSDQLVLDRTVGGFQLGGGLQAGLRLAATTFDVSTLRSQRNLLVPFDQDTGERLLRRLDADIEAASMSPPRSRYEARLAVGRTMLALGLAREATGVLDAACADEPGCSRDPKIALMREIISVADPGASTFAQTSATSLPTDDDVLLWSALAPLAHADTRGVDGLRTAAATIRAEMPLIAAYPRPLGEAAGRQAAQILLASGTPADLRAVGALPSSSDDDLANAVALDRLGETGRALQVLTSRSRSRDPLVMANAERESILIGAEHGSLPPGRAADMLDARQLDWRLTGHDIDAEIAEAALQARAGQIRKAFRLWNDLVRRAPERKSEVDAMVAAALVRLGSAEDASRLPATDFVAIVEDNKDTIGADPSLEARVLPLEAEKLASLGLLDRAAVILRTAASRLPAGVQRGALELRAAELGLQEGRTDLARSGLEQADADGTAASAADRVALLRARLLEASGDHAGALAATGAGRDPPLLDERASLLAEGGDWVGCETILKQLVFGPQPNGGVVKPQPVLVLRLAAAASQAGDASEIATLVKTFGPMLQGSATGDALTRLARLNQPAATAAALPSGDGRT